MGSKRAAQETDLWDNCEIDVHQYHTLFSPGIQSGAGVFQYGIEAARQSTGGRPEVRSLVLASFAADNMVFPAIEAGAADYLLNDSSPDGLVRAIRQVHRGEPALHPALARKLLQEVAHKSVVEPTTEALTLREMAVLRLIAENLSNQEIVKRIAVSAPTVRNPVSRILGKLHLASRT